MRICALLIIGGILLFPAVAFAASFTVNPVRVELAADRPYAVMQIENTADTPITLQARAYNWIGDETQGGGLTPTDDVILNPPLLTIEPKNTRFVRLGLRKANRGTLEATYRLILQEVPKAVDPAEGAAVRTILRISIPIFASPKSAVAPKLEWTLQEPASGKFKLIAVNKGNAHIQLRELAISSTGKTITPKTLKTTVYVLPGQSHEWEVEAADFAGESQIKVVANTDAGESQQMVGVSSPSAAANPN